ncbi:Caspase domain-containing protein [Nonlabens sp. Hel1_33_55]|uniref:caspase family protein n=1 Tax=Nonlabens sp. Hel1_33_55 TaxID=1336802 RepID=UPI000875DAA9|nr:caspase family protein [Nonlabens sp. Hel1_33_55]SCX99491.1 Caspase domain-containing protein [Nonlabens sp. Hel1_33_55]
MKKILFTAIFCLTSILAQAEKYAIIVAVGDYPENSGWGNISSVNDVDLIKTSLASQGFLEKNMVTIMNDQATKAGLLSTFADLQKRLKKGDILVVHFSMHGQQVFDDNGDEVDNLDEALVPFDAFATYSDSYTGQNHLRDDDLGNIIKGFRNKLGADGQLLFLLDSCHSGGATRGAKARGGNGALVPPNWDEEKKKKSIAATSDGSDLMEKVELNKKAAPFVMISGASSRELNYEYKGNGSLSYAFAKAMTTLGTDFTYRQLFNKITAEMATIAPRQKPAIEGDIDYKLFKGEYVQQQPYFTIKRVVNPNSISVNAGSVQQFNKGTTAHILPAGTAQFDEKLSLAKGTVTRSMFNESRLLLDKELPNTVAQDYIVFIDQIAYGDLELNVYLKDKAESIEEGVKNYLETNALGNLVTDISLADVVVEQENGDYFLKSPTDLTYLNADEDYRGASNLEKLQDNLFTYAQGSYIRSLKMSNPTYEFSFKLIPALEGTEKDHLDEDGVFKISEQQAAYLEVTNHSNKDLYFTIVEVYTDGKIIPFMPNSACDYTADGRLIPRKSTKVIKGCSYTFAPPYERIVLKGFASTTPINLEPVVTRIDTRSSIDPLEALVKETYTQSRGGSGSRTQSSGNIAGFTTEFVYEIVEKL